MEQPIDSFEFPSGFMKSISEIAQSPSVYFDNAVFAIYPDFENAGVLYAGGQFQNFGQVTSFIGGFGQGVYSLSVV